MTQFGLLKVSPVVMHPRVEILVGALVQVHFATRRLLATMDYIGREFERHGPPKPTDWPGTPERDQYVTARDKWLAAERAVDPTASFAESEWPSLISEITVAYREWRSSIEAAIAAAEDARDEIDEPGAPLLSRTSGVIVAKLKNLFGHMSPFTYGEDGLGVVRCRLVQTPPGINDVGSALFEIRAALERTPRRAPIRRIDGWTTSSLCETAKISAPTFHRICGRAKIKRAKPGGHGFQFGPVKVRTLISACRKSSNRIWRLAADRWEEMLQNQIVESLSSHQPSK